MNNLFNDSDFDLYNPFYIINGLSTNLMVIKVNFYRNEQYDTQISLYKQPVSVSFHTVSFFLTISGQFIGYITSSGFQLITLFARKPEFKHF